MVRTVQTSKPFKNMARRKTRINLPSFRTHKKKRKPTEKTSEIEQISDDSRSMHSQDFIGNGKSIVKTTHVQNFSALNGDSAKNYHKSIIKKEKKGNEIAKRRTSESHVIKDGESIKSINEIHHDNIKEDYEKHTKSRSLIEIVAREAVHNVHDLGSVSSNSSLTRMYAQGPSIWVDLAKRMSDKKVSHNIIVRRSVFLLITVVTLFASIVWGTMYYFMDLLHVAMFCWTYTLIVTSSFALIEMKNSYYKFEFIQLASILFFPCAVQVAQGGVRESGACMMWGILAPVGAALFHSADHAEKWFYTFVIVCISLAFYDCIYGYSEYTELQMLFFMMNQLGSATCVYLSSSLFSSLLEKEYEKSEKMLHNILPRSIANRIKEGETKIVDNVDNVTILFADLVGFTRAASIMCPSFLIGQYLRHTFLAFDKLAERRNLEKIKTIGDAYMVVGGLNNSKHNGTKEVIFLAFEFLAAIEDVNEVYGTSFDIRIGVHTGSVVAGVLGVKKFAYDIWGDAVNTASRMESTGIPGKVHISAETYQVLKNEKEFKFTSLGEQHIKGKGIMDTFLVESSDDLDKSGHLMRRDLMKEDVTESDEIMLGNKPQSIIYGT